MIHAGRFVLLMQLQSGNMANIIIDGISIEVPDGYSILEAARQAGIDIPSMCDNNGVENFASCMVCIVKDRNNQKLIPSCSVKITDGMGIITNDEEVREARKTALELLLSEHVGDCEAPCQIACPAHMNIPAMNRFLAAGKPEEAFRVVREDIALPSVLGRICPAPCEGACRRKTIDEPVSICLLKRYAGDTGIADTLSPAVESNGKKIAIVGAGPAGLSAAYYLQIKGFRCTVFDRHEKAGGALMYAIPDDRLDKKVLEKEIEIIMNTGVIFTGRTQIEGHSFDRIRQDFSAVVIATGNFRDELAGWGLTHNDNQVLVEKKTYRTNLPGVFAVGNVNRSAKLAIRSLGQGKEVSFSIEQYLNNRPVTGEPRGFNSRFGMLMQHEFQEYLKESVKEKAYMPSGGISEGYSLEEVRSEARRCLHCDCRKPDDCKLRTFSDSYQASQRRFSHDPRKQVRKITQHDTVIYEPEKCIKCGICVRITSLHMENLGLTFIGRGFDVEIGIPFNAKLNEALTKTAGLVAEACPTGALALRNGSKSMKNTGLPV